MTNYCISALLLIRERLRLRMLEARMVELRMLELRIDDERMLTPRIEERIVPRIEERRRCLGLARWGGGGCVIQSQKGGESLQRGRSSWSQ